MAYDRKRFFDAVRASLFPTLDRDQVAGCEALLAADAARGPLPADALAYLLATVFWETGRTMRPVREAGRGRGLAYGVRDPETGQSYYGRGLVQLTWKVNYAAMSPVCGVDLVAAPDLALRPDLAVAILFEGMVGGRFTGRRLADYFGPGRADWTGARRIVNGTDHAAAIAALAQRFAAALHVAAAGAAPDVPPPTVRNQTVAARLRHLLGLA